MKQDDRDLRDISKDGQGKSFFQSLSPEQKAQALAYSGPENFCAPTVIDPMEAFAEVPRVLPTFSTRFGLRMSYVDSAGKQRCLTLKPADLTRILHSGAMALEAVTRPARDD